MIIAYADPPYPGQAKKHYSDQPIAKEVNHKLLIGYMCENFDGWALSTSSTKLQYVLSLCPEGVRVGAWVKPFASFKSANPAYVWEPVIFWGFCNLGQDIDTVRDWVSASPPVFTSRNISNIHGEKPAEFCYWLFSFFGMYADDTLVDIFPGSGAVTYYWQKWRHSLFQRLRE